MSCIHVCYFDDAVNDRGDRQSPPEGIVIDIRRAIFDVSRMIAWHHQFWCKPKQVYDIPYLILAEPFRIDYLARKNPYS